LIFHFLRWIENGGENVLWSRNGHKGFTPKLFGSEQQFPTRFGGFLLHAWQQGLYVSSVIRVSAWPWRTATIFWMNVLFEQQRSVRMPQVMDAKIRKTSLFDQRLESTG